METRRRCTGHELVRRCSSTTRAARRTSRSRSSATTTSPTARWPTGPRRWRPGSRDRGVGAGDVVGLLSYNCPEFLETIFAANYLGAIAMPINWRLAAPEVRYILEHSRGARARVRRGTRRPRRTKRPTGMEATLVRVVHRRPRHPTGGQRSPICARRRRAARRAPAAATTSTG